MKKMISTITVLILVLGFSAVVFASSNEYEERHDYERSEYHGNYPGKFYGTVEGMPEKGWQGIWIINGREVLVTNSTKIEEEYGKAAPGAYVEVEGNYAGKTFTAYEIEVKGGSRFHEISPSPDKRYKDGPDDYSSQRMKVYNSKFAGIIESMPEGGYEGMWIIGGRKVEVNNQTMIDETDGSATAGAYIKVRGIRTGDTITAYEIEVKSQKK